MKFYFKGLLILFLILSLAVPILPQEVYADGAWSGQVDSAPATPTGMEDLNGNIWSYANKKLYVNGGQITSGGPRDVNTIYGVNIDDVGNLYLLYAKKVFWYTDDDGNAQYQDAPDVSYRCANYDINNCVLRDTTVMIVAPNGDYYTDTQYVSYATGARYNLPSTVTYSGYSYTTGNRTWTNDSKLLSFIYRTDGCCSQVTGYAYYNPASSSWDVKTVLSRQATNGSGYTTPYVSAYVQREHENARRTFGIWGSTCDSIYNFIGGALGTSVAGTVKSGCTNLSGFTLSLGNIMVNSTNYYSYGTQYKYQYLTPRPVRYVSAYSNSNRDKVTVQWPSQWQVDNYNVYRDGVRIGTTSTTSFTDEGVREDTTYTYTVTTTNPGGESPGRAISYYNPKTPIMEALEAAKAAQIAAEAAKAAAQASQAGVADLQNKVNYITNTQLVNIGNAIMDGSGNTAISVSKAVQQTLSSGGQIFGMIDGLDSDINYVSSKVGDLSTSLSNVNTNLTNNINGVQSGVNGVQDSVDDLSDKLNNTTDQLKSSLDEIAAIKSVVSLNKNSSSVDKKLKIAVDLKPGFTLTATAPGLDSSRISWPAPDLCEINIDGLSASEIPDYIQMNAYSGSTLTAQKKIYRKDFYFELIDIQ